MGYLSTFKLSTVQRPDGFTLRQVVDFLIGEERPYEPHLYRDLHIGQLQVIPIQVRDSWRYQLMPTFDHTFPTLTRAELLKLGEEIDHLKWKEPEQQVVDRREGLFDLFNGRSETKWYDFDVDMKRVAKQFPEVIFKLHREGEDRLDITDHYYHGGKTTTVTPQLAYKALSWENAEDEDEEDLDE